MRTALLRHSKYSSKIDGDVIKNRIDAQKASMIDQEAVSFSDLATLETNIKSTLDAESGVTVIQVPFYLAFGRRVWKIANRHGTGTMATAEAQLVYDTWLARGLVEAPLVAIAALVGITVTS